MSRSILITTKYLNHVQISFGIRNGLNSNLEKSKLCYIEAIEMITKMKEEIGSRKTTPFTIYHHNSDEYGIVQEKINFAPTISDISIMDEVNQNYDLSPIFKVYPDNKTFQIHHSLAIARAANLFK